MINNRCLAAEIRELIQRWDGVPPVVFGPVSDAQISHAEREEKQGLDAAVAILPATHSSGPPRKELPGNKPV